MVVKQLIAWWRLSSTRLWEGELHCALHEHVTLQLAAPYCSMSQPAFVYLCLVSSFTCVPLPKQRCHARVQSAQPQCTNVHSLSTRQATVLRDGCLQYTLFASGHANWQQSTML